MMAPKILTSLNDLFKKIFDDRHSKNQLENHMASYIVNELKYLNLKYELETPSYVWVFLFSIVWLEGEIDDPKTIEKGCRGLCSDAGIMVLQKCSPELILREYKE